MLSGQPRSWGHGLLVPRAGTLPCHGRPQLFAEQGWTDFKEPGRQEGAARPGNGLLQSRSGWGFEACRSCRNARPSTMDAKHEPPAPSVTCSVTHPAPALEPSQVWRGAVGGTPNNPSRRKRIVTMSNYLLLLLLLFSPRHFSPGTPLSTLVPLGDPCIGSLSTQ